MTSLNVQTESATARHARVHFSDLLRSEWIKLTSLPTMLLALGGIFATGVGGALFLSVTLASSQPPSVLIVGNTMGEVTGGMVVLGQIIAGILGVMAIGSEYSSGTIQPTLLGSPTRLRVLWAKTVVVFMSVTVTAVVTVFTAWAVSFPFYAEFGLQVPLGTPGVGVAMFGAAVYLGLGAVFGLGIGALVRSTTVGSIIVFVATLLGPVMASVLPFGLFSRIVRVSLLGNAGDAMARVVPEGGPFLDVWTGHISTEAGWIIASVWAVVTLAAGAIVLKRRDA
ncbi:hypothetical protein [Microbacterium sp. A93]|uniref:hypothetical protein n=1 Tax=Microbacterium sp. A93 TaxID=3450716 RepID=UPI003F41EDC4